MASALHWPDVRAVVTCNMVQPRIDCCGGNAATASILPTLKMQLLQLLLPLLLLLLLLQLLLLPRLLQLLLSLSLLLQQRAQLH
jgi:hypothetical protein